MIVTLYPRRFSTQPATGEKRKYPTPKYAACSPVDSVRVTPSTERRCAFSVSSTAARQRPSPSYR